ncbi:hypothetical protein BDL97_11G002900 [Sphagnum fallax]|nr:hypothetical protein BDL97_11G002900 [Sphagnum fallax]
MFILVLQPFVSLQGYCVCLSLLEICHSILPKPCSKGVKQVMLKVEKVSLSDHWGAGGAEAGVLTLWGVVGTINSSVYYNFLLQASVHTW